MRRVGTAIVLLLGLLAATAALRGCTTPEADGPIARAIHRRLARPFHWFRRATVDDDDIQPLVRRFYRARGDAPAWTHLDGPTPDAIRLLDELAAAPEQGLSPSAYGTATLRARADSLRGTLGLPTGDREARFAALDVALTREFLKYAAHRLGGQVNPLQLPADWHIRPRGGDLVPVLEDAVDHHRVRESLEGLDPRDPEYAKLRDALARYRRIAAAGGWAAIPPGPPLRPGQGGGRVLALQRRLVASGDLAPAATSGSFDAATEAAVRSAEERFGFDPDGIASDALVAELNRPVGYRIRQLQLNLERRRWLPDSLSRGRYVEVNIPAFQLEVVESGRPVLGMRVVVGKTFSPTPMFADQISYLVLNPTWNVPQTIAGAEILPALQRDPGYLEKNHMRLFTSEAKDAPELDPGRVDWGSMTPESFHYAVRQDPGPDNAVGHVKFMCPNQFDVYLHDTPAGQLFDARQRGFSHGCIRVERPVDLAAYLLRGRPGWDAGRIEAAFDTSRNWSVTLPQPVPVHIVYWTAFVDDRGRVQFRDDVYGLDALLDRALRTRPPGMTASGGPAGRDARVAALGPGHRSRGPAAPTPRRDI